MINVISTIVIIDLSGCADVEGLRTGFVHVWGGLESGVSFVNARLGFGGSSSLSLYRLLFLGVVVVVTFHTTRGRRSSLLLLYSTFIRLFSSI